MAEFGDEYGPQLADSIRARAPVRSGELRDSIFYQRHISSTEAHFEVKSRKPQARFVLYGTSPHEIRPVIARALHWVDAGGNDVFARRVHHPGTQPNPFPSLGVADIRDRLQAGIAAAIRHAITVEREAA